MFFLQRPHYQNFNKRLVKSPKLYFYDTGLLTCLLEIETASQIHTHFAVGQIFENLIMSEYKKYSINSLSQSTMYYWRDKQGHEMDLVTQSQDRLNLVELKSSKTFNTSYLNNIIYLQGLADKLAAKFVIYAGDQTQSRDDINIVPWDNMQSVFEKI